MTEDTTRQLLDAAVAAYIHVGTKIGYYYAERILSKHLPDNKPGGLCSDVLPENLLAFTKELRTFELPEDEPEDEVNQELEG